MEEQVSVSPKKKARGEGEQLSDFVTTTFRLTRAQWAALRREALEISVARGSGRPDSSEALRAILDAWMAKHR
jgi:hypothetical protein